MHPSLQMRAFTRSSPFAGVSRRPRGQTARVEFRATKCVSCPSSHHLKKEPKDAANIPLTGVFSYRANAPRSRSICESIKRSPAQGAQTPVGSVPAERRDRRRRGVM
ncbi:MAG: hypothetical protein FD160_3239 [Caulobacteraceae bacterium]|nr:MAG: hypothetical protein FD160_3239 [Caulobacteraceae bacterium]